MLYVSPVTAETWNEILPLIRRRFPDVAPLTTDQLALWLADSQRPSPLLVDARSEPEYAVSHLQGALRATTLAEVEALRIPPERPVVIYCSVGYRSAELASKWIRAGRRQVFNLEGSIFAWANEGRPVYRGTNRVNAVHPFDRRWGVLLDRRWHPGPDGEVAPGTGEKEPKKP